MMRRGIWTGLSVLTMLASGWMQGQAVATQDDKQSALLIAEREIIVEDAKCVLIQTGERISWGCLNSNRGCYGSCSEGVYAEPASVCIPSTNSICVGRKGTIRVIKTHEGYCLSNCSCKETRRVPDEPVLIEAIRCN